jgi:dTDP-3-amino-3,4,6-trideoxy-alpha-D-glucose transaminase
MIALNDFTRQWEDTRTSALSAFETVGASGWYVLGSEVREFEAELAAFWGLGGCTGVASGLDAIEIALRVLGCGAGDRVLTTPLTAFATTLAIVKLGAVPVFVDVDAFGLLDLDAARAVAERDAVRFCVPVHLYGHALDLDALGALARDVGVAIVEDCAQSIGARFRGRPTGTVGRLAATSFYPTKNLGALGDGGAILGDDPALLEAARVARDYGQTAKYRHDVIGYNSRLDELQAALLRRVALPMQARWAARRRALAQRYVAEIANPRIAVPGAPPGSDSAWHLFPVHVEARDKAAFVAHLRARGVASGEHYPIAVPDQRALARATFEVHGDLAVARRLCATEVSLPIHPYLTDDEAARVIAACNAWTA